MLRVNSDAADELHVHSSPEHTFAVKPQPGQQYELNQTVATIQVQP